MHGLRLHRSMIAVGARGKERGHWRDMLGFRFGLFLKIRKSCVCFHCVRRTMMMQKSRKQGKISNRVRQAGHLPRNRQANSSMLNVHQARPTRAVQPAEASDGKSSVV